MTDTLTRRNFLKIGLGLAGVFIASRIPFFKLRDDSDLVQAQLDAGKIVAGQSFVFRKPVYLRRYSALINCHIAVRHAGRAGITFAEYSQLARCTIVADGWLKPWCMVEVPDIEHWRLSDCAVFSQPPRPIGVDA